MLAVSIEKIITISIYVLKKVFFFSNLGPLIKLIHSTSSNQTPPCHSARSYAESQNLYPTDFTMMDSATSRGMTMNRQTGLFIPESKENYRKFLNLPFRVLNPKANVSTQPFRNRKSFLFQELWIEEFGLITRSAVAEDGDNRFSGAQFCGQANCTSDVDPG